MQKAVQQSINHWGRMISCASQLIPENPTNESYMKKRLGEDWHSSSCALCQNFLIEDLTKYNIHSKCQPCPFYTYYQESCANVWRGVSTALTWGVWIEKAIEMKETLKKLLIKVGDKVKITKKYDYVPATLGCWIPDMDRTVGQEGIVRQLNQNVLLITFDGFPGYYYNSVAVHKIKKSKTVKSLKTLINILIDDGYVPQGDHLYWSCPGKSPAFSNKMFQYCGKPEPSTYNWREEWLTNE